MPFAHRLVMGETFCRCRCTVTFNSNIQFSNSMVFNPSATAYSYIFGLSEPHIVFFSNLYVDKLNQIFIFNSYEHRLVFQFIGNTLAIGREE